MAVKENKNWTEFWRTHAMCPYCGAVRPLTVMQYEYVEGLPPDNDPQYAYDLADDYFCKGIYTGKWITDPCDLDAYESCFSLYCQREGIEL